MSKATCEALACAGAAGLAAAVLAVAAGTAAAQQYPERPVRIVVNVSPGGGVDTTARIVSTYATNAFPHPFVVDNRLGAGGAIGVKLVADAEANGYTLLICSSGIVTNAAFKKVGYDPIKDLVAITVLTATPYVVVATPSLPAKTVGDLIARVKNKPGSVSYASSGVGSITHMAAALLVSMAGTPMLHVPYKGVADSYPRVSAGEVDWMVGATISSLPLIKAGRLKPLAVTSKTRSRALPDVPTVAESGYPAYEVLGWFGFFAPAGTPGDIVQRLNAVAREALQSPKVARRMEIEGTEVVTNAPGEAVAMIAADYEKWRDVVRQMRKKP